MSAPLRSTPSLDLISQSTNQTREVGAHLGRLARPGDLILLHGDLGAGKTTLAQGIAQGLAVTDYVQSPTFTLVAEHEGRAADGTSVVLYHLDLYRLADEADLDSFGFEDYLTPADGVTLVEWPERAADRLPDAYLLVRLEATGAAQRRLTIEAIPPDGPYAARLAGLRHSFAADQPAP